MDEAGRAAGGHQLGPDEAGVVLVALGDERDQLRFQASDLGGLGGFEGDTSGAASGPHFISSSEKSSSSSTG